MAWCGGCVSHFDDRVSPWAWLLRRVGGHVPPALEHLHDLPEEPPGSCGITWHDCPPAFLPCPLCGFGEASSEHLCIWCPAVAYAWAMLTGRSTSTILADVRRDGGLSVLGGSDIAGIAAVLGHQIAFLYGSMASRNQMQWRDAGAWLARAAGSAIK